MEFKILILVLVVVVATVFTRLFLFGNASKWPVVEGKIVRSVIAKSQYYAQESYGADVRKQNVLKTEYYLDLLYTYSVKGQSFEGKSIVPDFASSSVLSIAGKKINTPVTPLSDEEARAVGTYSGKSYTENPSHTLSPVNKFDSIENVALMQKRFPEGVSIPVHYNPANPASSGLLVEGLSSNRFLVIIGGLVLGVGIAMFFALRFIFSR